MERIGYNGYKEHIREPQYEHDGDCCTYLGRYRSQDKDHIHKDGYDLYYCPQGNLPTVIMRFGNDGWEYYSGIALAEAYDDYRTQPLIVAAKVARSRAIQMGIHTPK